MKANFLFFLPAFYGPRSVRVAWTNPSPLSILVQAASMEAKLAIVLIDFYSFFYFYICFSPTSGKLP